MAAVKSPPGYKDRTRLPVNRSVGSASRLRRLSRFVRSVGSSSDLKANQT